MTHANELTAYPLHWPDGWKRTDARYRKSANFGRRTPSSHGSWMTKRALTVADARGRVFANLERMGIQDMILSTNLKTRLDGTPRSDGREPEDPGAAIYWADPFNGGRRCMAIDLYDRVADNIAALAATLEAMRAIERHGGAEILDRAFTGFAALPAPEQWWHVLGFENSNVTPEQIRAAHARLARDEHPDRGGSDHGMARINWARDRGMESIKRR